MRIKYYKQESGVVNSSCVVTYAWRLLHETSATLNFVMTSKPHKRKEYVYMRRVSYEWVKMTRATSHQVTLVKKFTKAVTYGCCDSVIPLNHVVEMSIHATDCPIM